MLGVLLRLIHRRPYRPAGNRTYRRQLAALAVSRAAVVGGPRDLLPWRGRRPTARPSPPERRVHHDDLVGGRSDGHRVYARVLRVDDPRFAGGARGDGIADDYAAIQAAIDACVAAGGGVVYFPAGVYLVSQGLVIPTTSHHVALAGPWGTFRPGGNTHTSPVRIIATDEAMDYVVLQRAKVTVSDIEFDADLKATHAWVAWGGGGSDFLRVGFAHGESHCFLGSQNWGAPAGNLNGMVFNRCRAHGSETGDGWHAIKDTGNNTNNWTIRDSYSRDNRHGVTVGGTNWTIEEGDHSYNSVADIAFGDPTHPGGISFDHRLAPGYIDGGGAILPAHCSRIDYKALTTGGGTVDHTVDHSLVRTIVRSGANAGGFWSIFFGRTNRPEMRMESRGTPSGVGIFAEGDDADVDVYAWPKGAGWFWVEGPMALKDGVTAPAARSGKVAIYVDAADGDLYAVFGNGVVRKLLRDAAPPAYTPTNVTTTRSFDADNTTLEELADVVGTMIADHQAEGGLG